MSGPPKILSLIADSQKHAVNLADLATRTRSIATTKGSAFHTSSQKSVWIIDSGATDHMTFDHSQLISCKSSTPSAMSNANDSVLLVPSLDHNLLSVAQLTTTLGCTDILIGKTIGCGTRRSKLYYLDWAPDNETKFGQAFTTNVTRSEGERDKIIPFSKLKRKSVPSFNSSIKWWRLSFMPEFRSFVLTMMEKFSTMILTSSYTIIASYINVHAPILPNKMEWLKERTDIYWK
ncbi:unnamed protein product [Prunus armeniaca]